MDANDLVLIEKLLARQPVEILERLARYFTPSALARRCLADRDAAIRSLAVGRLGTGRDLAGKIHQDLHRYAASGFRFERDRPPDDPRRALMHRVLVLNRENVPGDRTLRYALAGLGRGQNSGPPPAQDSRDRSKCRTAECVSDAKYVEGDHRATGSGR